jgi:hypothetical protein
MSSIGLQSTELGSSVRGLVLAIGDTTHPNGIAGTCFGQMVRMNSRGSVWRIQTLQKQGFSAATTSDFYRHFYRHKSALAMRFTHGLSRPHPRNSHIKQALGDIGRFVDDANRIIVHVS